MGKSKLPRIYFQLTEEEKAIITRGAILDNRKVADFVRNASLKFANALILQDGTKKVVEAFKDVPPDISDHMMSLVSSDEFKDFERLMAQVSEKEGSEYEE